LKSLFVGETPRGFQLDLKKGCPILVATNTDLEAVAAPLDMVVIRPQIWIVEIQSLITL
jgi:hypothetical protein